MTTDWVATKSSAVSVWILPGLEGRESVAIFPSGSPVEKEKEAAEASGAIWRKASAMAVVELAESAAQTNCSNRPRIGAAFFNFVSLHSLIYFICITVLVNE